MTMNLIETENNLSTKAKKLSGVEKAALLMIALDVDVASIVFQKLAPNEVENISTEISRIKNIPSAKLQQVLEEFFHMATSKDYLLGGGPEYAEAVLEKSFGLKAKPVIEKIKNLRTLRGFDALKEADSTQLVNLLNKENPQTIALILSRLNPEQTASVLMELDPGIRSEVAFRISTLGKISPETIKEIEKVVDQLAGLSMGETVSKVNGPQSLANILNRTSNALSKEVLEEMDKRDSNITLEVKRLMFMFDSIIDIDDRHIQRIVREVDRKDLALSLKVADDDLKEKIFKGMSERAVDLLKEELDFMGKVKLKDVEAAQAKVIDVIKKLEEEGEIELNTSKTNEEVYV